MSRSDPIRQRISLSDTLEATHGCITCRQPRSPVARGSHLELVYLNSQIFQDLVSTTKKTLTPTPTHRLQQPAVTSVCRTDTPDGRAWEDTPRGGAA